ncbi:MAG: hypothetical protein JSV19_02540 [Phycisphaerales bacterium]|nr:MAG: hypothetical protein JSV19_02540 [Phycisphaerales bacterium]
MPSLWSLVKGPEEFWGDLTTHGQRLLGAVLHGTGGSGLCVVRFAG